MPSRSALTSIAAALAVASAGAAVFTDPKFVENEIATKLNPTAMAIAPDGRIFEGRAVEYEPETNTKYPVNGNIGIELMGDFEKQRPSPAQLKSCVALTAWLCDKYKIDLAHVRGHMDAAQGGQTDCPGKDFYRYFQDGQLKAWLKASLAGQQPTIEPGKPLPGGPTKVIGIGEP